MQLILKVSVLTAALWLTACAATPPNPDLFNSAEQAIDAAVSAGAEEHSPVELKFARERLDLAREAVEKKKYDAALIAVAQSEINSELAIEKSRTALERRRVTELRRANDALEADLKATYGEDFE